METINARRMARIDGEFVVFVIGMRINRWWKFGQWMRVGMAMPKMIKELEEHPELGYLGGETWIGRTFLMVQYWRSSEQLLAFAKDKERTHMPAWKDFYKRVGTNGDVGIWHETYKSRPGDYEAIYVNMPKFGLGKVGELLDPKEYGARQRLDAKERSELAA